MVLPIYILIFNLAQAPRSGTPTKISNLYVEGNVSRGSTLIPESRPISQSARNYHSRFAELTKNSITSTWFAPSPYRHSANNLPIQLSNSGMDPTGYPLVARTTIHAYGNFHFGANRAKGMNKKKINKKNISAIPIFDAMKNLNTTNFGQILDLI